MAKKQKKSEKLEESLEFNEPEKKVSKEKISKKNELIKKPISLDFSKLIKPFKNNHKVQFIALIIAIILIVSAACISLFIFQQPEKKKTTKNNYAIDINEFADNQEVAPEPTTLPRRLDGLMVSKADANRVPVCVMIENAAFDGVRPQAGLSAASVVYEVIVEGGITRLMAVFAGEKTDQVGPIRSARDTYLEFASELDCAYTHAGGSYTAMVAIDDFKLKDIDALREGKYFWRDSNKNSPHNLFSSTDNLYTAVSDGHSWKDESTYESWLFQDDSENRKHEGDADYVSEINIGFGGSYDVTYKFNQENNNYERFNGGVEHKDSNTDKILKVRNVIIQKVPEGWYLEGKGRINFAVTGEGEAVIFNQGTVIKGTWKKANRLSRTKYYDSSGKEIPLVRGNIWVEIVPEDKSYSWK